MPVIPPFSDYAPAPNLAQAFLGQQRLQQEAAADAARISLGYATLRQRAVENEMQLAAQKEALSRENLRKAQETEIEKAYRDTQLGLMGRRLAEDERVTQMKLQQAASDFAAEQEYNRLISRGMDPQQAMQRVGFGRAGFAASLTDRQASEIPKLNLENRILEQQKRDLLRPYNVGGVQLEIPPKVQAEVDALSKRQSGLLASSPETAINSKSAPAKSSGFIGVPGGENLYQTPEPGTGFIGVPGGENLYQTPTATGTVLPASPSSRNQKAKLFYNLKTQKFE